MEENFAQYLRNYYKEYILEQIEKTIIDFGISPDKFTIASKYFNDQKLKEKEICIDFNDITGVWHIYTIKNSQILPLKSFTSIGCFVSELVPIICDDYKEHINLGQKIMLAYQKAVIKFHNAYVDCVPTRINNKR